MTEPSPPGILGAANALVGLVTRLFPNSLDRLEEEVGPRPSPRHAHDTPLTCPTRRLDEEVGHFGGPPPALLPDTDPARVAEMMLAADDIGLGEMGANQVVIVRSASAKKKLPPLLRSGLVLTVEESKGLEFDDVCIFDFFADSDMLLRVRARHSTAQEHGDTQGEPCCCGAHVARNHRPNRRAGLEHSRCGGRDFRWPRA